MWAWPAFVGVLALEPVTLERALNVSQGPCLESSTLAESTASWLGRGEVDESIAIDVHVVSDERVAFQLSSSGRVTVERELAPPPAAC